MVLTNSDENHETARSLRGIIYCAANGRIRCAGSLATTWLRKYFPDSDASEELPSAIRQWLWVKSETTQPLRLEKNGDSLVVTLVDGEPGGPSCLLLEETSTLSRLGIGAENKLTRREAEVLSWVAQGKPNWAIGKILNVSPGTVRKHLEHVYSKLGVENRTAAALCALEALRSVGLD